MDREDLRALAQSALNEFATEFATSERPRRLWQETKSGVYFDESAVVGVLETAIQQYASSYAHEENFEFLYPVAANGTDTRSTAQGFAKHFYNEVRDIICNPKRQTEAAKLSKYKLGPTCAGLSFFIMQQFGFSEPIAIGVATYLLIVLLECTKGAFCKMGKEEVYARMGLTRRRWAQGTVKKWFSNKACGLLVLPDGRDVFVHANKLPPGIVELIEGEAVRVEIVEAAQRSNTRYSVVTQSTERDDGKLRATRIELLRE